MITGTISISRLLLKFKAELDKGWSVTVARKICGLHTKLGSKIYNEDPRFVEIAKHYRKRQNAYTKRNKVQDKSESQARCDTGDVRNEDTAGSNPGDTGLSDLSQGTVLRLGT